MSATARHDGTQWPDWCGLPVALIEQRLGNDGSGRRPGTALDQEILHVQVRQPHLVARQYTCNEEGRNMAMRVAAAAAAVVVGDVPAVEGMKKRVGGIRCCWASGITLAY